LRLAGLELSGPGEAVNRSVEKGENLRRHSPVPALGHSSPMIWGTVVCVTTAAGSATLQAVIPRHSQIQRETQPKI
jgi:hypothetical protein